MRSVFPAIQWSVRATKCDLVIKIFSIQMTKLADMFARNSQKNGLEILHSLISTKFQGVVSGCWLVVTSIKYEIKEPDKAGIAGQIL